MFPDDLVFELLIRLPGKQIARCKCVCKSWRSIIKNAYFKDVYGTRQFGLILHRFEPVLNPSAGFDMSHSPLRLNIFHSPFRELKDSELKLLCELGTFDSKLRMTQIVNGLLCVDHGTAGTGTCLTIYNVCTREKMTIPNPLPSNNKDERSTYYLGYDPASKMYKLLRLMRYHSKKTVQAHIMTLRPSTSSSTWRELSHYTSGAYKIRELRTYTSDGFLCWMDINAASILLFDLNEEKFHKVLLPDPHVLKTLEFEDMFVRAQFTEHQRLLAVSLWGISRCSRFGCFVMDYDEGKRWSQHSIENPQEKAAFVDPKGKSSANTGKMVPMNTGYDVFSMMTWSEVVKQPDRPVHMWNHIWNSSGRKSFVTKLSCLLDGNNLYLPLDDILGG